MMNMCFEPEEMKKNIDECIKAHKDENQVLFEQSIKKLEKQLQGVVLGEVDTDALVHSFM